MEEFVEKLLPNRGFQPIECVASGIGERRAKSEHFLKCLVWVQFDDVVSGSAGLPDERGLGLITQLTASHADRNLSRWRRSADWQGLGEPGRRCCCDSACRYLQKFSSGLVARHC